MGTRHGPVMNGSLAWANNEVVSAVRMLEMRTMFILAGIELERLRRRLVDYGTKELIEDCEHQGVTNQFRIELVNEKETPPVLHVVKEFTFRVKRGLDDCTSSLEPTRSHSQNQLDVLVLFQADDFAPPQMRIRHMAPPVPRTTISSVHSLRGR